MELLDKLNPMQREGVETTEGPVLILAGAGSGKTRVLTHRIAYLIDKGVDPFNIIAVTFTNKAAKEMKERAENLSPLGGAVWISTFHSTCVRILRKEISRLGYQNEFTIYDADESERLIKACSKELNVNDKQFPIKGTMYEISNQKNELISAEEYATNAATESDYRKTVIAQIYSLYQKRLKLANAMDFDDLIFKTVELFVFNPDVLKRYQERFKYIMIDEYQDTNTAQYRLVELLAERYKNICVVGDDDQSIYGWRGANVKNILDFETAFPGAKVIKLEQNYRSTDKILSAANSVISNNNMRKEKKLWTQLEGGEALIFRRLDNDIEEAGYIAATVQKHVTAGKRYGDFAVLYRTNAQSRVIEEQLILMNIPYKLFGGVRFYERQEIKDVLAYLKIVFNPFDDMSFRRIINVPRRGIGDTTSDRIFEYAASSDIPFFKALGELDKVDGLGTRKTRVEEFTVLIKSIAEYAANNSVKDLLEYILDVTGYIKQLELENTEESKGRIENLSEFISKAADFSEKSEDKTLGAFLEQVALVADIDSYEETDDYIVLMTLHSSKGLEFPCVFISGFEEGVFPSYRSVISNSPTELEEERRLCYVGITRAKEKLFLTAATQRRQHGQIIYNSVSRFYEEIPKVLLQTAAKKQASKTRAAALVKKEQPKPFSYDKVPTPQNIVIDFAVGDNVAQMRYGVGLVTDIKPAGADYEVTVEFSAGTKKFMAHLAKLKKVSNASD